MLEKKFYDLTNPQKSIWVTEQFYKGSSINNICGTAVINEEVDFSILEKAILLVLNNNDIFKIRFAIENDKIQQYLSDDINSNIIYHSVKNYQELDVIRKDIVSKPFNLLNSYAYNFYIFKMPNNFGAFMLNIHHILADAWTLGFTSKEIIKTYSQLKNNQYTKEPPIYTYEQYIESEKTYLNSEKFQKDKKYWEEQFTSIPEVAVIPGTNKKSIYENDFFGKRKQFELDENLVFNLKSYCAKNKISLYNFFMAIYAIYISEISNLNDFVIGTPILNRTNFKEKNVAGMFINVEPFRITIDPKFDFSTFTKNIAINSLEMLRHQKYSYQLLLENLRETNKNIPNLYNILFSYQVTNAKNNTSDINYSTEWTFNGCCAENLDIQIFDLNDTGKLNVSYDYKVSMYNELDIINIHKRILHIINQVISTENINLNDIEIITPEEKNQLVFDFNKTDLKYDANKTVIKCFEEQVQKTPNKISLVSNNQKLTYSELNQKANSLATYLIKSNIKKNDIIGIMLNRSPELIIGILAILKCGATYLPIDPEYPSDRISYMLENSETKMLLVNSHTEIYAPENCSKINIELTNLEAYSANNVSNIDLDINSNSLAYLIYTSGSTGKPKGVRVTNKNLINFITAMKKIIDFNADKTLVSVTTMCFDIFGLELWCSLSSGLTLVLANEQEQDTPALLNKLCQENNVNIIQTTPSRYSVIFEEKENLKFLENITDILVGGEAISTKLLSTIKKNTNAKIFNMYGPTETTIWSTFKELTNEDTITIGTPVANTKCYILNNNHKLLPINMPGELYIGGDGVSNGYLKRDDLNNEKFIDSPFEPRQKIYNTNDLAYFKENGEIVHLGRTDFQVKIRGFRIELGEIENIVEQQPIINKCIVVKKQLVNNHDSLIAYYTLKEDTDIKQLNAKLKVILSEKLPQYMVPQYFMHIDKILYTPNGKVDKNSLPDLDIDVVDKNIVDPRNDLDKNLIKIISKMVTQKNISLDDTLLDLGGDSLTAITLSTKILSKFDVQISIKDLLSNYTIKDISDYIQKNQLNVSSKIKIEKAPIQELYPLSSAQRRIYYNSKMISEKNTVYNLPGAILVDKILDINKIKSIFNKIIERHSALRTSFVLYNDQVMQKVEQNIHFEIPVYQNKESEINSLLNNFSMPFNLDTSPLIRAEVHYLDNRKTLLLLEAHHIIIDGTGLNNLIIEFNRLYNGANLKKIPIQYIDYAVWENKYNESDNIKKYEDYWVNKFIDCDFSPLNLPYDYNSSSGRTYNGHKISKIIDEKYFRKLERFSKKIGVSPYMLFLSIFFILLYKYTGQNDINIGSPIANRNINETKRMIGMFANNIVVRGTINSKDTFRKFLENIKEQVLDDLSNQPYPFDMLVKKLNVAGDISKNPLFDVMFTYQNKEENIIDIDGTSCQLLEINNNISKFNLSLEIKPTTHTINIEYCTDLFKEQTIEKLFNNYLNTINCIINNIDIPIKDISIISDDEKNKILYEFNNTKKEFDTSKTILELFEEQSLNNPDGIAVIFEDSKITYKDLNEKANCIAHFLNFNKITKNDVISIRLNRSFDLIISILAVLKSGASYILIDPSLPIDRINYMIKNANSKLLITHTNLSINTNISYLNIDEFDYASYSQNNLNNIEKTDNLCILYTSGSTGNPKGVSLTKKGFTNLMYAFDEDMNISDYKNILGIATVAFDMFEVELYSALTFGHTLILANEEEQKNIIAMSNLIKKYNVDFFVTTPSRVELLLLDECKNPLKNVKCFQLGGEKFTSSLLKKLKAVTNAKIYNGYGPTEISACCSNKLVTSPLHKSDEFNIVTLDKSDDSSDTITIGKPLSNVNIFIFTEDMNLCPIGVIGEICVGGYGVSNGYVNNNELTAKAFVKNPQNPTEIIYKTGDLGKYNSNGEIEYIGRKDDQIKIRGLRVELSEIELKLNKLTDVNKSAVLYIKNVNSPYLIAFVTSSDTINVHHIKSALAKSLPDYMIPRYIIQIENFPLTLNGKIDKKALQKYSISNNSLLQEDSYTPPETEEQKLFCDIWSNLLNTNVGIDDNLFDIGADSLLAINFKAKLLSYNIDLPYADIFKYKTIRLLSKNYQSGNTLVDNYSSYDYTRINQLLESQNTNNFKLKTDNNVLLLGSNGFVGMHILYSFIKQTSGKIYCIVREKNKLSAVDRFKNILHYYFDDELDTLIDKRIFIINGNIVKENFGLSSTTYKTLAQNVDVIINSAANVKHYGNENNFLSININTINTIIDFCLKYNKRLLHISSLSVSGNMLLDGSGSSNNSIIKNTFTEKDFFIGQNLDNVYTKSKFDGEKLILENIIENNLKAQILRLGNITNRFSDGKFQINYKDNAFVNRIKSFIELNMIPNYLLNNYVEFTPVDLCADAIISILNNNYENMCVYHIFNNNHIYFSKLLTLLKQLDINIEIVDELSFNNKIHDIIENNNSINILSGIINDFDSNQKLSYHSNISVYNQISNNILNEHNFKWLAIDLDYIEKYLKFFKKNNFIN